MQKIWYTLFLEERPSISLSLFRMVVALTVGLHLIPTFFHLEDTYLSTALKTYNSSFFPIWFLKLVGKSPDSLVIFFVILFCISCFSMFIGLFSYVSCLIMTLCCYYFYALNDFAIGHILTWDILMVTLFLMCCAPFQGDYFSVDCLLKGDPSAYKTRRPFYLQRLLQMQVAFTYFYTGLYKISPPAGNWLTDNPIYYLMNYPVEGVTKLFLLKDFLAVHPQLCNVLGLTILFTELAMPVLLFNPRTRLSAIYLGIVFHITLILTLDVPSIFFFLFPPQLFLFIHPDHVLRWIEQKRLYNQNAQRSILVYDGNCQFCRMSVQQLRVMDLFNTLNLLDFQRLDNIQTLHPKLTRELAHSQIHLIEPDGNLYGGFDVFRRLCFTLPMLYPLIPIFYFPGAGIVGPWVYRWIAKNRYLFHFNKVCKDNACFR